VESQYKVQGWLSKSGEWHVILALNGLLQYSVGFAAVLSGFATPLGIATLVRNNFLLAV